MTLKERLHEIIFGTDTPAGKLFDVVLLYAILLSVLALMLDSVASVAGRYGTALIAAEWVFTVLFTLEYGVRLYCSPKPGSYAKSFYGVVDLMSILPSYISLLLPGANYLLVVRLLRVLRVFRVFKLSRYLTEANTLVRSLLNSRRKIFVFFMVVLVISTVFGSIMFVVEGPENGFTSIPISIYWTVVTVTTVGYGDIIPQTAIGKMVAALAMLTGYSIIAVPTGIVTAELANELNRERTARQCQGCKRPGHDSDARHCKHCGDPLGQKTSTSSETP